MDEVKKASDEIIYREPKVVSYGNWSTVTKTVADCSQSGDKKTSLEADNQTCQF